MTFEDQVAAMFAKANPVPSLDLLDAVEPLDMGHLEHQSERSSDMTDVETLHPRTGEGRPRPRLIPALVIIAAALVAIPIVLNRQVILGGADGSVAVVLAYQDARNDVETMRSLVAPNADVDISDQSALTEWQRSAGYVFTDLGCEEISSGPDGTVVACAQTMDSPVYRALGLQPTLSATDFLVKDGQIQAVTERPRSDQDERNMAEAWTTFHTWVLNHHGGDAATMYDDANGGADLTPESNALWEQYTEEFVSAYEG